MTASALHRPTAPDPAGTSAVRHLIPPGSRTHRTLLACALIGGLLFNATIWIAGAVRPGYDALRQPMSALSLGPGGWVQMTNFIVFGALGICFALALRATLSPGRGATWAPLLQAVAGLSMIFAGVFAEDPSAGYPVGAVPPTTATMHGMVHLIATFVSLTATVAFLLVLASRLAAEPGWRGWATWLRGTAILMMALLAAFGFAMATPHGPAGLFEKAATIIVTIPGTVLITRVLARAGRLTH